MTTLANRMKEKGFEPSENTDGEWQPYKGTYRVSWATLRQEETKDKTGTYWIAEWNIEEMFEGMPKRDSQYADLRDVYFFDLEGESDERSEKALERLVNNAYTFGVELDFSSSLNLKASAEKLIGKEGFIRAYPKKNWKKEGDQWVEDTSRAPKQGISVQKKTVAEKKKSEDSVAF